MRRCHSTPFSVFVNVGGGGAGGAGGEQGPPEQILMEKICTLPNPPSSMDRTWPLVKVPTHFLAKAVVESTTTPPSLISVVPAKSVQPRPYTTSTPPDPDRVLRSQPSAPPGWKNIVPSSGLGLPFAVVPVHRPVLAHVASFAALHVAPLFQSKYPPLIHDVNPLDENLEARIALVAAPKL